MRAADQDLHPDKLYSDDGASAAPPLDWRGCTVSATALAIPASTKVEDWYVLGQQIHKTDSAVQWWLGDWWRFGERYGRRVEVVRSDDWNGPTIETCRNAASVCRAFDASRRRDTLRFGHHAEVASLPAAEADLLLDWAEATIATTGRPRPTRELRAEVTRRRRATETMPITAHVGMLPREPVRVVATVSPSEPAGRHGSGRSGDPPYPSPGGHVAGSCSKESDGAGHGEHRRPGDLRWGGARRSGRAGATRSASIHGQSRRRATGRLHRRPEAIGAGVLK